MLTPHDGSFAVDLVQNLNLSGQMVSSQLQQLAERDPKWARVRHLKPGGGFFGGSSRGESAAQGSNSRLGGRSGIGLGNSKAMTSAMSADVTGRSLGSTASAAVVPWTAVAAIPDAFRRQFDPSSSSTGAATASLVGRDTAPNPYLEGRSLGRGAVYLSLV